MYQAGNSLTHVNANSISILQGENFRSRPAYTIKPSQLPMQITMHKVTLYLLICVICRVDSTPIIIVSHLEDSMGFAIMAMASDHVLLPQELPHT